MARQKALLIPKLKKGLHPDVIAAAIQMVLSSSSSYKGAPTKETVDRFVHEYEEEHGEPVFYIP